MTPLSITAWAMPREACAYCLHLTRTHTIPEPSWVTLSYDTLESQCQGHCRGAPVTYLQLLQPQTQLCLDISHSTAKCKKLTLGRFILCGLILEAKRTLCFGWEHIRVCYRTCCPITSALGLAGQPRLITFWEKQGPNGPSKSIQLPD